MGAQTFGVYVGVASQIADGIVSASKMTGAAAGLDYLRRNAGDTAYEWGQLPTPSLGYAPITVGSDAGVAGVAGATRYISPLVSETPTVGESTVSEYVGLNGNVVKFWFRVSANAATADSTVNLRVGGATVTGATITVGAGATGYFEVTGISGAITDNALMSVELVNGAGGTVTLKAWGFLVALSSVV